MISKKTAPKKATKKSSEKSSEKQMDTLVVFILDKSGSMASIQDATISGFNEYTETLRKDLVKSKSKYTYQISLTLFDTVVKKEYVNSMLSEVGDLDKKNYQPDGMTALYDAAMQTINETEKTVRKDQKVLCVIMTDGQENSSKEFTDKDLSQKIKELEKKNWSFVFLGANQDSYLVGKKLGLSHQNVANYNATMSGMSATMRNVASNTVSYAASSLSNTSAFFSDDDKNNLAKS